MKMARRWYLGVAAIALAAAVSAPSTRASAQQSNAAAVSIGDSDIGGVVTGANGPEAGVWVIAETTDLPTKYVKIVVTDDQGRYVIPDLPKANYDVWVRGYGLVDSPKVKIAPGKHARSERGGGAEPRGGGRILSGALLVLDAEDSGSKSLFPGTGPNGNGMPISLKDQGQWLAHHQDRWLQFLPSARRQGDAHDLACARPFQHLAEAWERRLQSGQASRDHGRATSASSTRRARCRTSAIGPTASPRANCPRASRRVRWASSATSSSRSGIGTRQDLSA